MAVNKVIYGGNTLVDLTGDTVTAADLADGVKATGADGNPVIGLMQKVTIDAELSTTSTNPVQNKVIKAALDNKLDLYGTAAKATADGEGNAITTTYAKKADISGMVKSVNGTAPDDSGNVTITVSGGASTSSENTWTATQKFYRIKALRTTYSGYYVEGASDTPPTDTMWYKATGAFTLDLSNFVSMLGIYESVVFSAYFTAAADYALTINGAGTMTYVGSASDIAISSSGTLLTIWMVKNADGVVSIVQAHKLGSGT